MVRAFCLHILDPLSPMECSVLWRAITGRSLPHTQFRPMQILTGGNPRFVRILAEFAHGDSFRDLMNDLIHLIDEHTEYFKSQLDTLPANERKAFVALLDLWDRSRLEKWPERSKPVSTASAYLNRLISRGAVSLVEPSGRKKLYQSTERLYNIYYLMRKRGHPSNRVRAAVRFMCNFIHAGSWSNLLPGSLGRPACWNRTAGQITMRHIKTLWAHAPRNSGRTSSKQPRLNSLILPTHRVQFWPSRSPRKGVGEAISFTWAYASGRAGRLGGGRVSLHESDGD